MKEINGQVYYSIGEFAKIIGKTVQTLRNWDKTDTRCPDYTTETGIRYYKEETVRNYCRAYGIPFGEDNPRHMLKKLENQMGEINNALEELPESDNEVVNRVKGITAEATETVYRLQEKI